MKATHAAIARGLAGLSTTGHTKTACVTKTAKRRWLEDPDLIKLCRLFEKKQKVARRV